MNIEEIFGVLGTLIGAFILLFDWKFKINPISAIIKWIGKQFNASLKEELNTQIESIYQKINGVEKDVTDMKKDFKEFEESQYEKEVNQIRREVFDFSSRIKRGINHTETEYKHVIDRMTRYDDMIIKHNITNGYMEEHEKFIKDSYQKKLLNNDFLV